MSHHFFDNRPIRNSQSMIHPNNKILNNVKNKASIICRMKYTIGRADKTLIYNVTRLARVILTLLRNTEPLTCRRVIEIMATRPTYILVIRKWNNTAKNHLKKKYHLEHNKKQWYEKDKGICLHPRIFH